MHRPTRKMNSFWQMSTDCYVNYSELHKGCSNILWSQEEGRGGHAKDHIWSRRGGGCCSLYHKIFEQPSVGSRGRPTHYWAKKPPLFNRKFCATSKIYKKLFCNKKMWILRPFSWNFSLCDHKLIMLRNVSAHSNISQYALGYRQRSHFLTGGRGV